MNKQFKLTIDTDNAAFEDAPLEVARILREIASELEQHGAEYGPIRDLNGNKVGQFSFED